MSIFVCSADQSRTLPFRAESAFLEFHEIDQRAFASDPPRQVRLGKSGRKPTAVNILQINYKTLLHEMQHTRDVLWALDTWIYEHHGQIEDWLSEMESS